MEKLIHHRCNQRKITKWRRTKPHRPHNNWFTPHPISQSGQKDVILNTQWSSIGIVVKEDLCSYPGNLLRLIIIASKDCMPVYRAISGSSIRNEKKTARHRLMHRPIRGLKLIAIIICTREITNWVKLAWQSDFDRCIKATACNSRAELVVF